MGHLIQGPGQKIQGPIQRHFGPSFACRVYFLRKSIEFHDIHTECQIMKTYHSFLTVLIIYLKFPPISQSINPQLLSNFSPISPHSSEGVMTIFLLPQGLKNWTLLQIYLFLFLFPLQWMNLQKYFSLKIHQYELAAPTHQNICLLCEVQRDLLVHLPPHKGKMIQRTTFIWVYFPWMNRQILTVKNLTKCFNQVNKHWIWKDTSLSIIYFIK